MFTKREINLSKVMVAVQVLITLLIFFQTELIYFENKFDTRENIYFMIQIIVIWSLSLSKFRLGIVFRAIPLAKRFRGYLVTVLFGCILFYTQIEFLPFILDTDHLQKFIIVFGLVDLVALVIFKAVFYYSMLFLRRSGYNTRHLIIVADTTSIKFINYFIRSKDWGYKIEAILSPDPEFEFKHEGISVIKNVDNLKTFITKNTVDDIFYCLPIEDTRCDLQQLIVDAEEIGVTLHIMQQSYLESLIRGKKIKNGLNNNCLTHSKIPTNYMMLKLKDVFDLLFSIMVLTAVTPLILLIAFEIWLEDGGPVFFKQERVGMNGRLFNLYKFRTMVVNAEAMIPELLNRNEMDGPVFKIGNDPRITHVGRFLRKTSLDELPQFYNVIKGEMSVVGPRPPLLREVVQYERSQLRRLSLKPGITCIWQVSGRNSISFSEWIQLDLKYIDSWSMLLDFKIMLKTVGVIFKATGH